jgi:dTDP-4-dehydrorhamnose reductase
MLAEITTMALVMGVKDPIGWIGETAGVYHLAGDGGTSRYQFAQDILKLDPAREQQTVEELIPTQTSEFPTPATRPLNAILDCSKFKSTFGISLPPWREALELMLKR